MRKDVGMRIRLDRGLRDCFLAACQGQDKPAAQVMREFMRNYVRKKAKMYNATPKAQNEQAR
jgi:hypothetical protein